MIPNKWLSLAGDMLDIAAERFANRGCSDWSWPEDWSPDDRREFAEALVAANVKRAPDKLTAADRADVEAMCKSDYGPPDWWVMAFLAGKLAG